MENIAETWPSFTPFPTQILVSQRVTPGSVRKKVSCVVERTSLRCQFMISNEKSLKKKKNSNNRIKVAHSYFGVSQINHDSLTGRFHLTAPQTLVKIYCHSWEIVPLDQSIEFKPAYLHWWLDSSLILFKRSWIFFYFSRSNLWTETNLKTDISELTQVKNDLL